MSRSIVLSNGTLCVALDAHAEVRDIYFPHVGLEDHVRGHYLHRIGIWADGRMSWIDEDALWQVVVSCEEDALASKVTARHEELKIELAITDVVYNERPVFVRRFVVRNLAPRTREIKLYFGQQFEIYKSHGSDTAYFDPLSHSVVHYKGRRVFLIGAALDGEPFSDWATGRENFQGKEGTHRDADDGKLSRNPIEHGPADSVIGLYGSYAPKQEREAYYWVAAAESVADAQELNQYVAKKSPAHMLKTTINFWHAWLSATPHDFLDLTQEQVTLFKRSLLYVRANVDQDGGIIASLDSDMLQYGLDTYSYVWPRDAAYSALALDRAGDTNVARRFFEFCRGTITSEGYFMHKYLPDRSLGSSWHPWELNGKFQLPIQEDETGLVLIAMREHFVKSHDLEFLEEMYGTLVERAANFLVGYRDPETKLPLPSYDLWERKRGTSTFTSSVVYGALLAAAELSEILGKDTHATGYRAAAAEVRDGIMRYLWDEKLGMFANMMERDGERISYDRTVDVSSVYGAFSFGVLPQGDERLARAFEGTVRSLSYGIETGGLARFENDDYYRVPGQSPGNPWILTTLWYAEYLIANARSSKDLDRVREIFEWVVRHAQPSGVLSEQLDPHTGAQVCAAPLTWAHAQYVSTVLAYLDKLKGFGPARSAK